MAALDHIGLSVADLDAQSSWYQRAFGLTATRAFVVPQASLRGVFLVGEDGLVIELLERAGSTHRPPASSPPDELLTQGWAHVCLRVASVDDVFAALIAAGAGAVTEPGPSPEPGVRFAFVTDPEGNFIELLDRTHPVRADREAS